MHYVIFLPQHSCYRRKQREIKVQIEKEIKVKIEKGYKSSKKGEIKIQRKKGNKTPIRNLKY